MRLPVSLRQRICSLSCRLLQSSDTQVFGKCRSRRLSFRLNSAASQYRFNTGLRERIAARAPFPYPSLYEASTGKITGLDYTLLVDAGVTGDEMRAILEYNLDLHLSGNHSPLIFVAHAHLYAFSNPKDNPDTPSDAIRNARWEGLTAFISYALTKQEVRIVAVGDVLKWIQAALLGKF